MPKASITVAVRFPTSGVGVIDIHGDVNGAADQTLTRAFAEATADGIQTVLLNFSGLEYMNSSGIGLLVTLLVRANRAKQKLMACGLSEHYKEIFSLTRLDEAISLFDTEAEALAVAQ